MHKKALRARAFSYIYLTVTVLGDTLALTGCTLYTPINYDCKGVHINETKKDEKAFLEKVLFKNRKQDQPKKP